MVTSETAGGHTGIDARAAELTAYQATMRACTRCVAAGLLAEAHPVFRGQAVQRLMIVGQAPGARAHERGVPWSGPGGDLLKGWLVQAGFPADTFLETWYLTSLTKCFPGSATSGKGDRAPSAAEIRLCADHLAMEIALVQPEIVVTLGRLAAAALIPGARRLRLVDLVGNSFSVDLGFGKVPVVPLPHPSGVSRWRNDPQNWALTDRGLDELCMLATERGLIPGMSRD
ncbi:MAG: uracil-DNA glycosylase family protein [Thermomicrobiales bacterium]